MDQKVTIGAVIRRLRSERDWTLAEMSKAVGIPLSTLAKVEHDRLSLTYDKLISLSEKLGVSFSELFSENQNDAGPSPTGRRSVTETKNTVEIVSRNYDDRYLCCDLRKKIMTPISINVKAGSLEDFGDLVRHDGEEFIYVVNGTVVVHTEYYQPLTLNTGEGHYLDSQMGHAYVRGANCSEATIIAVCAGYHNDLGQVLMEQASGFPPPEEPVPSLSVARRKKTL